MEIKAIETVYNGYRFRSRLEARWAVFFDAMGIKYEYEKEGYDLGELGWYLPDFEIEIPEVICEYDFSDNLSNKFFVEVKGNQNDKIGIEKANRLNQISVSLGKINCLIFGELNFLNEQKWEFSEEAGCSMLNDDYSFVKAQILNVSVERYNTAVQKARSARFEHGENGGLAIDNSTLQIHKNRN